MEQLKVAEMNEINEVMNETIQYIVIKLEIGRAHV